MARHDGRFLAPEVNDAVLLETEIADLRREIASDCAKLLVQALTVNGERHGRFNLKFWESRISGVREAQLATFSIDDLTKLKHECVTISQRLAEYGRA